MVCCGSSIIAPFSDEDKMLAVTGLVTRRSLSHATSCWLAEGKKKQKQIQRSVFILISTGN